MSSYNPNALPASFLRCMPKQERKKLGKAGMTTEEVDEKLIAKREKEVHRDISNWLRLHDIWFSHSRMDKRTTQDKGCPDYIFVAPAADDFSHASTPFAIEVKVNGNKLSPEQEAVRKQMMFDGWKYHVVSSLDELKKLLAL